jgi:hypothetical protein
VEAQEMNETEKKRSRVRNDKKDEEAAGNSEQRSEVDSVDQTENNLVQEEKK